MPPLPPLPLLPPDAPPLPPAPPPLPLSRPPPVPPLLQDAASTQVRAQLPIRRRRIAVSMRSPLLVGAVLTQDQSRPGHPATPGFRHRNGTRTWRTVHRSTGLQGCLSTVFPSAALLVARRSVPTRASLLDLRGCQCAPTTPAIRADPRGARRACRARPHLRPSG
jgi:hypothetical protein